MIVLDQSKAQSSAQLPTFQECTTDHVILDFATQPSTVEPPPEFTLYDADFITLNNGWIISHDPHLNRDGLSSHFHFITARLIL